MADLTTTISESVVLNNTRRGSTNTLTITDITSVFERTLTCAHSQITTIAEFNTSNHASESAIDLDDVRYVRVTNLSDSQEIILGIITTGSTNYQVRLTAGSSHIICQGADVAVAEADGDPSMASMTNDLSALEVKPVSTTNASVEVFIASIN
tara:strand:- start:1335 stop:1793 length:459 start_codon:yes stop_codon:yes gene_type:complete